MIKVILKCTFLLLSYLIGAIPFGYLLGKSKGIDIREHGSKNIGATNTGRVLGKKYAIIAFFCDFLKGALFTFLFRFEIIPSTYMLLSPAIYGLLAILGHTFSVFLKFKGGKAVATSCGLIFGYCPLLFILVMITFFVTLRISKMVSLGSLISSLIATISTIILYILKLDFLSLNIDIYFLLSVIIATIIIFFRHKQNIVRIFNKEESKVTWI